MMARSRPRRSWGTFPTTADMGIRATGANSSELLEALGLGLFSLVTDLRTVRPTEERSVAASAEDPESLVVAFLGQLLLLQQVDGFLVRTIDARAVGAPPTSVHATVRGEPYDAARHPQRIEVKAVTLHRLLFDPARGRARVIVDI